MAHRTGNIDLKWSVASGQWSVAELQLVTGHRPLTTVRGFTLGESLIASVVLAVAVVAVSGSIMASQQQTAAGHDDSTAVALSRQLIEQIASLPIPVSDATAGWPTVTTISSYDTIGDFNGYTDRVTDFVYRSTTLADAGTYSTASPNITALTGGAVTPGAGQYVRTVSVTYPTSIFGKSVAAGDFSAGDFAVVTVTTKGSSGGNVTLTRIVAKTTVTR